MTRRDHSHTHPCERCHVATACSSDLEDNPDGWPEVICIDYEMHRLGDFLCEQCAEHVVNIDDDELAL